MGGEYDWSPLRPTLRLLSECLRGLLFGRAEGSAGLSGSGSATVEAADHGVDRGPADERLGDGGVALVVAGQSAVHDQPGQAPFHHPPLRVHGEPRCSAGLRTISTVVCNRAAAQSTSRPAKP